MEEQEPGLSAEEAAALSRRDFVQRGAVVAGGALVISSMPGVIGSDAAIASPADVAYAPAALSTSEMATLMAIVERFIPNDDLGPGAVESGVQVYIDRALSGAYKQDLPLYTQNLASINAAAAKMGAASFAALSHEMQDTLLQQAETGKLGAGWAGFFQLLLEHAREGMFGDPMYGGNRNFAGWDLVKYPGIKLVWSAAEQAIGTKVTPTHTSDAQYGGHPAP